MLQLTAHWAPMRVRLLTSVAIGMAAGLLCWAILARNYQEAGDFRWAIRAAQALLRHETPYSTPMQRYPLPAAFFALPFVGLPQEVAGGLFFGISSGILAFGLTRKSYTRLFIFLAFPYWSSLLTAQWTPLVMAAAFFPVLIVTVLAKPQNAIPVAITHLSWRGVVASLALLTISLVLMPNWPRLWLGQTSYYQHFVPMLVFPGPVLLLALASRRDPDTALLLTAALMPQRWFYDAFILWLIPRTRKEILATVFLSWVPALLRWHRAPSGMLEIGQWAVLWLYLPMLFVLLLRMSARSRVSGSGLGPMVLADSDPIDAPRD